MIWGKQMKKFKDEIIENAINNADIIDKSFVGLKENIILSFDEFKEFKRCYHKLQKERMVKPKMMRIRAIFEKLSPNRYEYIFDGDIDEFKNTICRIAWIIKVKPIKAKVKRRCADGK